MLKQKYILSVLMMTFILITSCAQNEIVEDPISVEAGPESEAKAQSKEPHSYGGWYCPDNLGGFPPIDIQELDKITAISDRLPTQEEARNGTSLMYFDKDENPDAKPLDMELPKVARLNSSNNGINELIVVIQAVVVKGDTVVGYRFPNGGNGTAWHNEVSFLSDEEVEEIGPSPFVYVKTEISASKEEIWKAFNSTEYARKLSQNFNQQDFFESDWTSESKAYLDLKSTGVKAKGIVSDFWGNLYIQIDYNYRGFHFTEKMMVSENSEKNTTELHMIAGPYPKDYEAEKVNWESWLQEVKELSEKD